MIIVAIGWDRNSLQMLLIYYMLNIGHNDNNNNQKHLNDTVDGWNPAPAEAGSLPYLQGFMYPRWLAGFLPSTVWKTKKIKHHHCKNTCNNHKLCTKKILTKSYDEIHHRICRQTS